MEISAKTDPDLKSTLPVGATAHELLRSAERAIEQLELSLNRETVEEVGIRPFDWPVFPDGECGSILEDSSPSTRSPDSEVAIHIEIGSTVLSVEQLQELPPGTLIPLDNALEEPVVIYADDIPIALGELMIWNECYGVRITELLDGAASFQERK